MSGPALLGTARLWNGRSSRECLERPLLPSRPGSDWWHRTPVRQTGARRRRGSPTGSVPRREFVLGYWPRGTHAEVCSLLDVQQATKPLGVCQLGKNPGAGGPDLRRSAVTGRLQQLPSAAEAARRSATYAPSMTASERDQRPEQTQDPLGRKRERHGRQQSKTHEPLVEGQQHEN